MVILFFRGTLLLIYQKLYFLQYLPSLQEWDLLLLVLFYFCRRFLLYSSSISSIITNHIKLFIKFNSISCFLVTRFIFIIFAFHLFFLSLFFFLLLLHHLDHHQPRLDPQLSHLFFSCATPLWRIFLFFLFFLLYFIFNFIFNFFHIPCKVTPIP